jgi:hypothetical protein
MESILVGLIVSFLGIFIGIYLHQSANVGNKLQDAIKLMEKFSSPPSGVGPTQAGYLFPLGKEAKFWERLYYQRADKVIISREIATKYITEKDRTIIVDSGTTIDQIPYMLCQRNLHLKVFTNNLLAAVSVVPPPPGFDCRLLPGRIDARYGATYNVGDIDGPLTQIRNADKIILACPAISFEEGPLVDRSDDFNKQFKGQLIRQALDDPAHIQLIIAADWMKFGKAKNVVKEMKPVVGANEWRQVLEQEGFVLVATDPGELDTPEADRARSEIESFKKNSSRDRMKLAIVSPD